MSRRDNMSSERLKQEVIEESKRLGIDKIGFTSADPFVELKERLREQESLNYASGFEKGTNEERTEPEVLLKEAKSIISIALAYPSRIEDPPKRDRKSTRLNSSHVAISYAVFCLKKKIRRSTPT